MGEKARDQSTSESGGGDGALTVVPIPESQVQAVLDFVASLERDDVSGHMISLGSRMRATDYTMTKCGAVASGLFQTDWNCSDVDQIENA